MNYYDVLVSSSRYHGKAAITYASDKKLKPGSLVTVTLRQHLVTAVVKESVQKPKFTTKNIVEVLDLPVLSEQTLSMVYWMSAYYPASLGSTVKLFIPNGLNNKAISKVNIEQQDKKLLDIKLPSMTDTQKHALNHINGAGTYLLHGDTGSGKTRVYLELAKKSILNGQSAIILIPEIGLTTQLYEIFIKSFGESLVVIHSRLTSVQRRNAWVKLLRSDQPHVVIGPRSALFSPLRNVGLIVIDESHETTYKQEQAPYYNALRVASKLASLHRSYLVFGSATPLVAEYYLAQQKKVPIIRMEGLAKSPKGKNPPDITLVDVKQRSDFTQSGYLSNQLISSAKQALDKREQILMFLNRRGTARIVVCSVCGWQILCPNCDVPLVYHGDSHTMRCHLCGHKEPAVSNCPVCNNAEITFRGAGTKAIFDEVVKQFPQANVRRFDADNLKSERLEQQYKDIVDGKVDILVGTQTLVKGLDLPKLSVVGVISADTSLFIPDYTSQEKMYQLITQVIGRVARGHLPGHVIIQTYLPKNKILNNAIRRDWLDFYETELEERQKFSFPPFWHLLKLSCRLSNLQSVMKKADELAQKIKQQKLNVIIDGPSPAFHERINNKYEWQLIIKSRNRSDLLAIIDNLPSGWSFDIDPANLL